MRYAFLRFQLSCIWACGWVLTWSLPALIGLQAWMTRVERRLPKPLPPSPAWYERRLRWVVGPDQAAQDQGGAIRLQPGSITPAEGRIVREREEVSPRIGEGVEDAEAAPEVAGGADVVDGREPK